MAGTLLVACSNQVDTQNVEKSYPGFVIPTAAQLALDLPNVLVNERYVRGGQQGGTRSKSSASHLQPRTSFVFFEQNTDLNTICEDLNTANAQMFWGNCSDQMIRSSFGTGVAAFNANITTLQDIALGLVGDLNTVPQDPYEVIYENTHNVPPLRIALFHSTTDLKPTNAALAGSCGDLIGNVNMQLPFYSQITITNLNLPFDSDPMLVMWWCFYPDSEGTEGEFFTNQDILSDNSGGFAPVDSSFRFSSNGSGSQRQFTFNTESQPNNDFGNFTMDAQFQQDPNAPTNLPGTGGWTVRFAQEVQVWLPCPFDSGTDNFRFMNNCSADEAPASESTPPPCDPLEQECRQIRAFGRSVLLGTLVTATDGNADQNTGGVVVNAVMFDSNESFPSSDSLDTVVANNNIWQYGKRKFDDMTQSLNSGSWGGSWSSWNTSWGWSWGWPQDNDGVSLRTTDRNPLYMHRDFRFAAGQEDLNTVFQDDQNSVEIFDGFSELQNTLATEQADQAWVTSDIQKIRDLDVVSPVQAAQTCQWFCF